MTILRMLKWIAGLLVLILVASLGLVSFELGKEWVELPSGAKISALHLVKSPSSANGLTHINDLPEHVYQALLATEQPDYLRGGTNRVQCILRQIVWGLADTSALERCPLDPALFAARLLLETEEHAGAARGPLKQLLLAWKLESTLNREQVVEIVLNNAYFGQGNTGLADAAEFYFAENAAGLDIAQAATLAGLIKGPSRYDPYRYPERARARRNTVLASMAAHSMISQELAITAQTTPLLLAKR